MKTTKLMIATVVCAAGAVMAGAAQANISPYISAKAGIGSSSYDDIVAKPSGFAFGGAVGARYAFTDFALRGELEYSNYAMTSKFDESDIPFYTWNGELDHNISTYMTNFYADLTIYKIKPYAGLSLGMMSFEEKYSESYWVAGWSKSIEDSGKFSKNVFTWGLNAGFGFNFTDSFGADIGVRYLLSTIESTSVNLFSGTFGLRYTF
jgi:opacity protein-like surface antigen